MNPSFNRLPPILRFALANETPVRPPPGPQPFAARPPMGQPPPSGGRGGGISPQAIVVRDHGMYLDAMFDRTGPDHRRAVGLLADLYAVWPELQAERPHPVDGKGVAFTPSGLMKSISRLDTVEAKRECLDGFLQRVMESFGLAGTQAPAKMEEFCELYLGVLVRRSTARDRSSDEGPSFTQPPPRTARGTDIIFDPGLPFRETEPASSAPRTQRGTEILPPPPRVAVQRPTEPLPQPTAETSPPPPTAPAPLALRKRHRFAILKWIGSLPSLFMKWMKRR